MGKIIICDEGSDGSCYKKTIDCGTTEDCIIYCTSKNGCYGTTINCTDADQCTVHCLPEGCISADIFCAEDCTFNAMGYSAAWDATINLPSHSTSTISCEGLNVVNVTDEFACGAMEIKSDQNATINMQCGSFSCWQTNMMVSGSDSDVNLECRDQQACYMMTVNASGNSHNTNLNISCIASDNKWVNGEPCTGAYIIGGENTAINMSCIEGPDTCTSVVIEGGAQSSINLLCSTPSNYSFDHKECWNATVRGGSGSHVNVSCVDHANCDGMIIDGLTNGNAASLRLGNCTDHASCEGIYVYCPTMNADGEKLCTLEGGDNLQITAIHAVNSWDDVEFITPVRCRWNESIMYCKDDEKWNGNDSCVFGATTFDAYTYEWQCNDHSSACYVEQPPSPSMCTKTVICDEGPTGSCYDTTIDCGITEDCIVYCNSTSGCYGTTINCTDADQCTVHCSSDGCGFADIFCAEDCTFNATGDRAAYHATINLPSHSTSNISCGMIPLLNGSNEYSCGYIEIKSDQNATINMQCGFMACLEMDMMVSGPNSDVSLECRDEMACESMTVNAFDNSHNTTLNISCIGSDNKRVHEFPCYAANIIGGDNTTINMSCIEGQNTCSYVDIEGGAQSSINLLCSSPPSPPSPYPYLDHQECWGATVRGGRASHINVSCADHANCDEMTIDGLTNGNAASLRLGNCTDHVSCDGIYVYCPTMNADGKKLCTLEGGDNLQIEAIHAVNSWDDVEFITPVRCQWDESIMYCKDDAKWNGNNSCVFGATTSAAYTYEWQCNNHSSACYVEQPLSPSMCPTKIIVCDEGSDGSCYKKTIDCGITEDCIVYCNSMNGCHGATINCTEADQCTIHCSSKGCAFADIFCAEDCTFNATGDGAAWKATINLPSNSTSNISCGMIPREIRDKEHTCKHMEIKSEQNATINMQCGFMACSEMNMTVSGPNSDVNLECRDNLACDTMTVNASDNSHNTTLNITCIGERDSSGTVDTLPCTGANIIGGENTTINMSCIEGPDTCPSVVIEGGAKSSINLLCSSPFGHLECWNATVRGGRDSHINVSCVDYANCDHMTIDGLTDGNAASLRLGNCADHVSCEGIYVYCPEMNADGEKLCTLEGGDSLQIKAIHAVNSWDDVEFITPVRCQWDESIMYCKNDTRWKGNDSCVFGANTYEWQCNDHSSVCYVEQPPSPPMCPKNDGGGLSRAEKAGIVLGVLFGVALLIIIVEFVVKNKGNDEAIYPISEESDAFMRNADQ